MISPTLCSYAPSGEYIKDHTLIYHDNWWHLFSVSGARGYCHLFNGNEETISWSISRNLVDWDFRGHVLHASLRKGEFDQHEAWAPYCIFHQGEFYMFYTGVVHPHRPMCYEKKGHLHPEIIWEGHRETQGLAVSSDLTYWEKISDREKGLAIPGRDSHVVRDEANERWLLYSTGSRINGLSEAYVSQSKDLLSWEFIGICAVFPDPKGMNVGSTESLTVMRHPLNGKWIMLGNFQYTLSDNPEDFTGGDVRTYYNEDEDRYEKICQLGFAGEVINWNGRWYRSAVLGMVDYWVLGFHEIEWDAKGAFNITTPSIARWNIYR